MMKSDDDDSGKEKNVVKPVQNPTIGHNTINANDSKLDINQDETDSPSMLSQISGGENPNDRMSVSSPDVYYSRDELRELLKASNRKPTCVVTGKSLTEIPGCLDDSPSMLSQISGGEVPKDKMDMSSSGVYYKLNNFDDLDAI